MAAPIDGMEADFQLSRDGVPVAFHHRTLYRAGLQGKRVHQFDFAFLRRLDLGGSFSAAFRGEPMPTLEEVLDRYGGRTRLFLEIKTREGSLATERHARLAMKVVEAVAAHGLGDTVYILSFSAPALAAARDVAPHLHYILNLYRSVPLSGRRAPDLQGLFGLGLGVRNLTRGFVERCHRRGLVALTFTCNSPRTTRRALKAGADVLITDHPNWLASYLGRTI
jgi:glycerophosphoryl diester phosphodiesterase